MPPPKTSLFVWPACDAKCVHLTCKNLEKDKNAFDCSEITPCSSTDSDSQDSFFQYDMEASERSIDNGSQTYHTSSSKLDYLDSVSPNGAENNEASAPLTPTAHQTARERVRREPSELNCSGGALHQHLIMMYFEGRWLDLVPLDAVEEDDRDPLSSLDIQVFMLSSFSSLLTSFDLPISCPLPALNI